MKVNVFKYMAGVLLAATLFSCQKDPMEDITDGTWNKERNIISLTLQNQLGPAEIIRDEFETSATVFVSQDGLDLKAVKIDDLVLSYNAKSNVATGQTLNFDNAENSAPITVMSETGESLIWNIVVVPYDMFYAGSWSIGSEIIYVAQEWGSSWNEAITKPFPNAATEMDNTVVFTYQTYENGRTKGVVVNGVGNDGSYGNYANDKVDINGRVRHLLPAGESTWELDLATNIMYIKKDDVTSEAKVVKTVAGMTLQFTLPYKSEPPYWDYGAHDNYLSWSTQFDIQLK